MELKEVFTKLDKARTSHLRWVAKAEALIEGVPLNKDQAPLLATDCDFGHWYHGEGRVLRSLPAFPLIDNPHKKIHQIYMQIFTLLYNEEERSTILSFFGIQRKNDRAKQEKARALLPQLKEASQQVLKALDRLSDELEQHVKLHKTKENPVLSDLEKLAQSLEYMGYGEGEKK